MKLEWVVVPEGPDVALKSGKVDVWHLLTDIPERHKYAYYTDPWLRTQFVIAFREGGPIRAVKDAAGLRVSHTNVPMQVRFAGQSKLPPKPLLSPHHISG